MCFERLPVNRANVGQWFSSSWQRKPLSPELESVWSQGRLSQHRPRRPGKLNMTRLCWEKDQIWNKNSDCEGIKIISAYFPDFKTIRKSSAWDWASDGLFIIVIISTVSKKNVVNVIILARHLTILTFHTVVQVQNIFVDQSSSLSTEKDFRSNSVGQIKENCIFKESWNCETLDGMPVYNFYRTVITEFSGYLDTVMRTIFPPYLPTIPQRQASAALKDRGRFSKHCNSKTAEVIICGAHEEQSPYRGQRVHWQRYWKALKSGGMLQCTSSGCPVVTLASY